MKPASHQAVPQIFCLNGFFETFFYAIQTVQNEANDFTCAGGWRVGNPMSMESHCTKNSKQIFSKRGWEGATRPVWMGRG
jgi:hypothetical protein